jgi:flagellar assembly protein FliH
VLGDTATESLLGDLAARTRDAAQAQGYAIGWAEGRRAAAARAAAVAAQAAQARAAEDVVRRREHAEAIEALARAAEQVRGLLGELTQAIEAQAAGLALALTEELVGHAVRSADPADVVRRVLAVLPDAPVAPVTPVATVAPVATVRLHPAVAAAARDLTERGVVVTADPELDRADALVEAEGAVVDLRVGEAMARLREVLR